jgi:acyl-CoA synthetase (AMP-forming)/AMP-acid ligase II
VSETHDVVSTVLRFADKMPDAVSVRTFSRRTKEESRTFGEVAAAAGRAAGYYASQGLSRGDVVVLLGTHHIDFYAAWLGCVWLGAIPTVLAEPSVRVAKEIYWSRLDELLRRIEGWGIAADPRIKIEQSLLPVRQIHRYDSIATHAGPAADRVVPQKDETLLLQHSSGTTGLQKGVMLTHEAVWRHAAAYDVPLRLSRLDVIASWLPLYHDMGFIACFLNPLLRGVPLVWLSPFEWVANPGLLLEAISRHKATIAWLPNFAFAFLAQRVKSEPGRFDLSSLRALVNCSEPVTAEAMQAFADRFSGDGFRGEALQTCYAMAENVFAVSSSSDSCRPKSRCVDRQLWHNQHRAVETRASSAPASSGETIVHVSNGRCVPECDIRVVDDDGKPLPADSAGRVLIRSPFLFKGYYRRDDLNAGLLDFDGFYDTGDLGYLDEESHVFITGRRKDLVIVGGKNVYPQDVEQTAGELPGVHPGRVVCFGVKQRSLATEGLVVLLESDEPDSAWEEIGRNVRIAIPARLDLDLIDVRVVARGTLRKSTSGKLARGGNREWYLDGRFGAVPADIVGEDA